MRDMLGGAVGVQSDEDVEMVKMVRVWCGVVWQAGCKLAGGEGMRGIAGTIYRSNIQLDPHTPAYTFFLHGTQTMAVFFEQLETTSKA